MVLCDYVNHTLLVRDVETEQDMVAAVRAGADLLQGRYLAADSCGWNAVAQRTRTGKPFGVCMVTTFKRHSVLPGSYPSSCC